MNRLIFFTPLLVFILYAGIIMSFACQPALAQAEQTKSAGSVDNAAPGKNIRGNATPVYVEFEGNDTIGTNLAFQLRERFNTSSLFTLTDKEQPKFLLILRTVAEFESRPAVGSVYAVTWLYYEKKTTYSSYLQQEIGITSADTLESTVARLVDHTTGIAARYGSLLQ